MTRLPRWFPALVARIGRGSLASAWLLDLSQDDLAIPTGKTICRSLWPFIEALPANVAAVRDALPAGSAAARDLLTQLADEGRHYQNLFVDQCTLAGLTEADLDSELREPAPATSQLCDTLSGYARGPSYIDGLNAIMVAELAATAFCRAALPHYERYFSIHRETYGGEKVDAGLAWLRLHAEPRTRHALWIKRIYEDFESPPGLAPPPPAEAILQCVFRLWQCPPEPEMTKPSVRASASEDPPTLLV